MWVKSPKTYVEPFVSGALFTINIMEGMYMRKRLKQAVYEKKSFENGGNKKMRKLRFGTLVLMLMPFLLLNLSAQGTDYITGKITDSKTGDPLPGTNVFIELTNYGAATDID